mmetsp:Transcript_32897/g.70800  ORF Transcript_32897/g.70800 Transcript_32897/m.70800 type:complete len:304 (+) Transcript_32897:628-1539(+)
MHPRRRASLCASALPRLLQRVALASRIWQVYGKFRSEKGNGLHWRRRRPLHLWQLRRVLRGSREKGQRLDHLQEQTVLQRLLVLLVHRQLGLHVFVHFILHFGHNGNNNNNTSQGSTPPPTEPASSTPSVPTNGASPSKDAAGQSPTAAEKKSGQEAPSRKPPAEVYGFGTNLKQDNTLAKKAIALRLEPLKGGIPSFERVLSEDNQNVVIGSRRGAVDIVVSDEAVSKRHCEFSLIGVQNQLALAITDYSTNGTWVNGNKVSSKGKKYRIRTGDRVQIKCSTLEDDFGWTLDFGSTVSFFSR